MADARVLKICIAPTAGVPMQVVDEVLAIAGVGLRGDRYAEGQGSWNRKTGVGNRQVTLINSIFFARSGHTFEESRRNLLTSGVELMWLIGREFRVGQATLRGIKYCDPCKRPTVLAQLATKKIKPIPFQAAFFDAGGLVAEVLTGGLIRQDDLIVPPPKGY